MEVTVEDVMNLPSANRCKVVAGKKGLCKTVRWFLGQLSPVIGPWVHGHEILFIYGNGVETNDSAILFLLEQCADKEISAIFFIIGPYLAEVPEAVRERADEYKIPLVEMPNDVPVVDITKEIADLLMYNRRIRNEKGNVLKNIIFGHESDYKKQIKILNSYGGMAQISKYHNIVCINISSYVMESVPLTDNYIEQALFASFGEVLYFMESDTKIVLLNSDRENDLKKIEKRGEKFKEKFEELSNYTVSAIGIGNTVSDVYELSKSYDNAIKALDITMETEGKMIRSYESLSAISKLLYEVNSVDVLEYCFKDTIGKILEYDEQHESDLFRTLQVYLEEDGNIANSAQTLYIHRNTMTYRINKINGIIDMKIEQNKCMQELSIAMSCYQKYIVHREQ